MDAAVVKFDALADAVRSSAQDHDFGAVRIDRIFVLPIVSGVVVGAVFCTADMNAFPGFCYAQGYAALPYFILGDFQKSTQVFVGKSVFFC